MAQKFKLTRAELNERSWETKKLKKKKGLARGSRTNPTALAQTAEQEAKKVQANQPKVVKAIPLNIPGRAQPLVSEKVVAKSKELEEQLGTNLQESTESAPQGSSAPAVDFVVKGGKVLETSQLQAKSKARSTTKAKSGKAPSASETFTPSKKLGKAALARLEAEGVAVGEEEAFFAAEKARKAQAKQKQRRTKSSLLEEGGEDRSGVMSRDYKAGRNTDYAKSQANAEKALKATKAKKSTKRSGEELFDLWNSLK